MFAFVFHSTKSRAYIAPFERILATLAQKHKLAFATELDRSTLPYRYSFIITLAEPKSSQNPRQANVAHPAHLARPAKQAPQANQELLELLHKRMLAFADALSQELPVSMHFVFHAIEPIAHCTKRFATAPKPSPTPFIPSVLEIGKLLGRFAQENPENSASQDSSDPATWSKLYKRFFSQVRCMLDSIPPDSTPQDRTPPKSTQRVKKPARISSAAPSLRMLNPHDLYPHIRALLDSLRTRSITLSSPLGRYTLSRTPLPRSTALFWDTSALQTYMRVDSLQISFLASIEKPSMRLCPKEIFRASFLPASASVDIPCQLAFDPMLMLFGALAREMGDLEYVFIAKTTSEKIDFAYHTRCFTPAHRLIVCGGDGVYIDERRSAHDLPAIIAHHYPKYNHDLLDSATSTPESSARAKPSINPPAISSTTPSANATQSTTNPQNPNARQMLTCYLSTTHHSALWAYNGAQFFELLPIRFCASERAMIDELEQHYQGADRLIANFRKTFGQDALDFPQNLHDSHSRNLIDMLALIARTLGYCPRESSTKDAIVALLDSAKLCLRDKGPRIDYKLKKSDSGALTLDYPRILRSCMSFALAGVEKELIAYGVLDSLAEFVGGFVRDVVQNYAMKQVFLCGDMLTHKVFLDKILLYLPRDIALILPQDGWVDSK